jgi:hypothetical protein
VLYDSHVHDFLTGEAEQALCGIANCDRYKVMTNSEHAADRDLQKLDGFRSRNDGVWGRRKRMPFGAGSEGAYSEVSKIFQPRAPESQAAKHLERCKLHGSIAVELSSSGFVSSIEGQGSVGKTQSELKM